MVSLNLHLVAMQGANCAYKAHGTAVLCEFQLYSSFQWQPPDKGEAAIHLLLTETADYDRLYSETDVSVIILPHMSFRVNTECLLNLGGEILWNSDKY